MNRLIKIKHDRDAFQIDSVTQEEIDEFEQGITMGPKLDPMLPFLESRKQNIWNDTLCDLFTEHFKEEGDVELTPEQKETAERMFLDRLSCLSRKWREARKFTDSQVADREKMSN